ncbi:hypothetical protein LBMAG52_11370 [Planctomycetia bacterium]|nr:hypothetical protein LBMAG52_11370 [Planctomycetia bacterium]
MKTLLKTLLWMIVLVAAGAYIGRRELLHAWNGRDAVLKQEVVAALQKLLPDADVDLDKVLYDFGHEVVLTDFSLTPPGGDAPIVQLPETVVRINRDSLIERQQLEVQKIVIKSPRLEIVRGHDGRWNWESLIPSPDQEKGSLPEIQIQDGTVVVRVEQAPGIPPGVLTLEHVDIELLPSGKRQFQITATSRCEHTGGIKLQGRWHIDEHTGQLDGELTQITAGQELVGVVASFAPDVRTKLAEWEAKFLALLSAPPEAQGGSPFAMPAPVKAAGAPDSIMGLKATFNIAFRISRPEPKTTPIFSVATKIIGGEITNPALPFGLQQLRGDLYADNDRFVLKELTAHNGATKLRVNGELAGREAGYPGKIEITVDNIVCDQRLRSRLSAGFGSMYDAHHPIGEVNMHSFLVHAGGRWQPEGLLVTAKGCEVRHDAFPYPIKQVSGSITQQGQDLIIDMNGMAGGRPISLDGTVANPGKNAAVLLNIRISDLPIDETFLNACNPQIRSAIQKMRLTGVIDGTVRLTKAPQQPFVPVIDAVLRNGAMSYDAFPYPIEGITGRLTAIGPNFQFKEMLGRHGDTRIAAEGVYGKVNQNVGELKLRIVTNGAPLDQSLFDAMPAALKRVWKEFRPTGLVDVVTDVHWLSDRPADIRMSSIELSKGSLSLKMLPYRLDDLRASYSYGPDENGLPKVIVKSIEARHGETQISAAGYSSVEADGNWRAHYDKFTIDNLTPNQELLDALSQLPGLRQLFASFDPKQSLRIDGVMDFKGASDPAVPITAAWDLDTYFSGGTIRTGLDFKKLHGKVWSKGEWDGVEAKIAGKVELASARILDYDLSNITGPFRVVNGALLFGAGDSQKVPPLIAQLFGGTLEIDGAATLAEQPKYRIVMRLNKARLEHFAALHAPKQRNLRGMMDGSIELRGEGSSPQGVKGSGYLKIDRAALLDMPVMLQMYQGLRFTPPDDYTFKSAELQFNIEKAQFQLNSIVLNGDAISFVGAGTADFESNVRLKLYSFLPRNQIPIPILYELVGAATRGWVRADVTGKLSNPNVQINPSSPIDDVLRAIPQTIFPMGQGLMLKGTSRQQVP